MGDLSPDITKRLVVYDAESGETVDVAGFDLRRLATPTQNRQYFQAGDGSEYMQEREDVLEVEILGQGVQEVLRSMLERSSQVRAVVISGGKHVLWQEPTEPQMLPQRPGGLDAAGERLRLKSSLLYPAIFQERNLLRALPWERYEIVQATDGTYYLQDADVGPDRPRWEITNGSTVVTTNASGELILNGDPTLLTSIDFPLPGGSLELQVPEGIPAAKIDVYKAGDTLLTSAETTSEENIVLTLPDHVFRLEVTITDADLMGLRPRLWITSAGIATGAEWGLAFGGFRLAGETNGYITVEAIGPADFRVVRTESVELDGQTYTWDVVDLVPLRFARLRRLDINVVQVTFAENT